MAGEAANDEPRRRPAADPRTSERLGWIARARTRLSRAFKLGNALIERLDPGGDAGSGYRPRRFRLGLDVRVSTLTTSGFFLGVVRG